MEAALEVANESFVANSIDIGLVGWLLFGSTKGDVTDFLLGLLLGVVIVAIDIGVVIDIGDATEFLLGLLVGVVVTGRAVAVAVVVLLLSSKESVMVSGVFYKVTFFL